jgi:hypothetical protein
VDKKFYCFFIMQKEGIESWVSLLNFSGARKKKRYLLTKKELKENRVESNDHLQEQLSLAHSLTHSLTSRENL